MYRYLLYCIDLKADVVHISFTHFRNQNQINFFCLDFSIEKAFKICKINDTILMYFVQ